MELSKRLRTIVSSIDRSVIADIGCDHALVCIEAVKTGRAQKAYACDLRAGPLEQAEQNVRRAGLDKQIEVRLQNGIHQLPGDVEQVVICGMGGKLIEQILTEDPLPSSVDSLLLCPHKDALHLRRFVLEQGWQIESERMISDHHFYPLMYIRIPRQSLPKDALKDEESLLFGFNLQPGPDSLAYLEWQKKQWQKILQTLPSSRRPALEHQLDLLESRQKTLQGRMKKPS